MKTGLTKKQKVTELWFTEADNVIFVRTNNTQLKNRLLEFSRTSPECCRLTDDNGMGGLEFEGGGPVQITMEGDALYHSRKEEKDEAGDVTKDLQSPL